LLKPEAGGLDVEARVSLEKARGQRLAALLLRPDLAGTCPVVVFAHGWGSSKASPRNRRQWELERARRELEERAAIAAISREGPTRLVVALPGGPAQTLEEVARLPAVHENVALVSPEPFYAVGQLYESFAAVSTEQVCQALRDARARRAIEERGHAG
jgi:hypothetical protein